jgi:TRAP-type uncharacterized transport system substrate-binding protein
MSKEPEIKIASPSRARSEIAARVALWFYKEGGRETLSPVTLLMGPTESEIGGGRAPIVVGRKKCHFNFSNPAALARMALLGRGLYKNKIPLRAIGVFPSWDRLVFAVHKDTDIRSLEEIKEKKYPLKVSTRRGGRFHTTLFAIEQVLKAYGFSFADIKKWGGTVLPASSPSSSERARHIQSGEANAVFDEGIKSWGSMALKSGMRFLPLNGSVIKRMEKIGFSTALIDPLLFPELDREVVAVDFSGWLFFCHRNLPSRIAYRMAKAIDLCHDEIPVDHLDRRGMTMEEFCRGGEGGPLTIPLHPGARRYYKEKGYLVSDAVE